MKNTLATLATLALLGCGQTADIELNTSPATVESILIAEDVVSIRMAEIRELGTWSTAVMLLGSGIDTGDVVVELSEPTNKLAAQGLELADAWVSGPETVHVEVRNTVPSYRPTVTTSFVVRVSVLRPATH